MYQEYHDQISESRLNEFIYEFENNNQTNILSNYISQFIQLNEDFKNNYEQIKLLLTNIKKNLKNDIAPDYSKIQYFIPRLEELINIYDKDLKKRQRRMRSIKRKILNKLYSWIRKSIKYELISYIQNHKFIPKELYIANKIPIKCTVKHNIMVGYMRKYLLEAKMHETEI